MSAMLDLRFAAWKEKKEKLRRQQCTSCISKGKGRWAVSQECGQEPLQFYWFRVTAKFFRLFT